MHLLESDRLIKMLFRTILIAGIGQLFVLEISAKYFVEFTDKSNEDVKITLYQCVHAPKKLRESGKLPSLPPNMPAAIKTSELPTIDDVMCKEVPEGSDKRWIYMSANFYVVSNLALNGGKRLFNTKRCKNGSWLLSREPSDLTSVGVSLFGEAKYDFPEIPDGSDNGSTLTTLRDKTKTALVAANVLDDKDLEDFAVYLGKDNFNSFIYPTQKLVDQVKLFGDVTERVINLHYSVMWKFDIPEETKRKVRQQVRTAISLLTQKMVDPCLVFGAFGSGSKEGDAQCNKICNFLAIGFSVFQVPSSTGLYGSIASGTCHRDERCWCKKERVIYRYGTIEHSVRMIELSNEVRGSVARKTPKSGVGVFPIRHG